MSLRVGVCHAFEASMQGYRLGNLKFNHEQLLQGVIANSVPRKVRGRAAAQKKLKSLLKWAAFKILDLGSGLLLQNLHTVTIIGKKCQYTISWVGRPPTTSGTLGICKDPDIDAITSCGHYWWVGAQPKPYPCHRKVA